MSEYSSLCDDFYINLNLSTEMDLPQNRETVLHFFERLQKQYPTMKNFYGRDKGDFILEEDKEPGHYRWVAVEARRLSSGQVNPATVEEALAQHVLVLDAAPYMLSLSPLDCEAIDILYGFDFTYRGNHNELVAEALGVSPALAGLIGDSSSGVRLMNCEPTITLAFDDDCRVQARVNVETRTNAYTIRTGEYPEEQLSVYVTARRYGSLDPTMSFQDLMQRLNGICRDLCDQHVIANVLQPLAQAIASH